MDYYPNIECVHDFVENTLPLLIKRRPSIKLTIVGADPQQATCASVVDAPVISAVAKIATTAAKRPIVVRLMCLSRVPQVPEATLPRARPHSL